jgi:hypothetical protein
LDEGQRDHIEKMSLSPGTKLGRYEIRSKLGEGGMGEVYRALDPKINREVAIKILPPALSADKDRLARFEQEAQAAGALNHPNILVIHHIDTHDGAPYIVSELLEGETLRERMGGTALPQRKAIDRSAVEPEERNAHDGKLDGQHIPFLPRRKVTRCVMHCADGRIGKGPGVKPRRVLCIAIVPKANRVLCWFTHVSLLHRNERPVPDSVNAPQNWVAVRFDSLSLWETVGVRA